MATKKQRKRVQKERRHEYETVWVDDEGNELEEPPDDARVPPERRTDGKKAPQRSSRGRSARSLSAPPPPSWRRALKRSLLVGVALFVFVYIANTKATGGARVVAALELAVLYGLLFTPFMYYLDKFAYQRWQRKNGAAPTKR